jgi:hypothetical protein
VKIRNIALAAVLALVVALPVSAAAPVWGVRTGDTVTCTNATSVATDCFGTQTDYFFKTNGVRYSFTCSVTCTWGEHVTFTRVQVRIGARYTWVSRYVFDGYNVWLTVPANSTVSYTGARI